MSEYSFRENCESCGQKPVLKDVGMCAVCTWGESDALWEWLDDEYHGKELKAAQKYIMKLWKEVDKAGMGFAPDIFAKADRLVSQTS